jgi:hypothetical protein
MIKFKTLSLFLQTLFEVDKRAGEGGIYTLHIECTVQYNIMFVNNYIEYSSDRVLKIKFSASNVVMFAHLCQCV